jgi:hypothetical protein
MDSSYPTYEEHLEILPKTVASYNLRRECHVMVLLAVYPAHDCCVLALRTNELFKSERERERRLYSWEAPSINPVFLNVRDTSP